MSASEIAFTRLRDHRGAIHLADPGTGAVRRLMDPGLPLYYPAWSPDGSRLVAIGQGVNNLVWELHLGRRRGNQRVDGGLDLGRYAILLQDTTYAPSGRLEADPVSVSRRSARLGRLRAPDRTW